MKSFLSRVLKILARFKSEKTNASFFIHSIEAASFNYLARRYNTQIFTLSMTNINNQLTLDREYRMKEISLLTVKTIF